MRNLSIVFLLIVLAFIPATAQVYFQNTMYNYNRFMYNPAAAGMQQPGMETGANITLLGRMQWVGIEGSPRLSTLSYHSPIEGIGGAIGAALVVDRLGPFTSTGLDVAYAFYLPIGDNGASLNIGVNGGFRQRSLNGDWQYDPSGGPDPILPLAGASILTPSLGAGIYFSGPEGKYFVGISGQDLLESSTEGLLLNPGIGEENNVPRSFFLIAGYRFDLSDRMSLTPSVLARTDGTFPPQTDVSLYWNYKPVVFGANYRVFNNSESIGAVLGFNVSDRTFLAYSYDYTLSALGVAGDVSTHEIIISYTFPGVSGNPGQTKDILDNPDDF